ncbi:MAG: hypothetical protein DHS20C15_10040 [Planctomycetota bacterium]|nr:MAG: hypothetical protein DHS20C15_10040 [Planctomycetota bacterium]
MVADDASRPSPAGGSTPSPRPVRALRPADRLGMRRKLALRDIRRAPTSLVVAALLHLGLFWAVREYWPPPEVVPEPVKRSVEASFDAPLDDLAELTPPKPPEPEVAPTESNPEPTLSDITDPEPPSQLAALGFGAGSRGRGGRGGGASRGGSHELDPSEVVAPGDPFAEFVSDLRMRGLDVVFVVDSTGSMQRFIDRAREVIDDVANDLSAVVPSLRLGLVAYRDLADDWVTRSSPLDADRYQLANFLIDLRASGGRRISADLPEAVEEGLRVATDELDWRKGARRVILLVGDAPYHEEDRAKALNAVRSFARDPQSVVNSLLIRADSGDLTSNELATREAFGRLVQAGGGVSFELIATRRDSGEELRQQVIEATFGREWKSAIDALLALRGPDRRTDTVERYLRKRDTRWFLRRLRDDPIHSLVVEGAAALMDRRLGEGCLALLRDATVSPAHRRAALYVLKRALPAARGVQPDLSLPLAADAPELLRLTAAVGALPPVKPAGRAAAPPAPPR